MAEKKPEPGYVEQAIQILSSKLGQLFPPTALGKQLQEKTNPPARRLTPEQIARKKRERMQQQAQGAGRR
jgi:hypothetical protein